jgi:hypothetical protein
LFRLWLVMPSVPCTPASVPPLLSSAPLWVLTAPMAAMVPPALFSAWVPVSSASAWPADMPTVVAGEAGCSQGGARIAAPPTEILPARLLIVPACQ